MDSALLTPVLVVLTFATALNLLLILRLARIVLAEEDGQPVVPLIGMTAPRFEARRATDGRQVRLWGPEGRPTALVFLSPGCPTCREKIPELSAILPGMRKAEVALWIACADDTHDIVGLTAGSPLADRTLLIDESVRKMLNPLGAAPIYLFIDETMVVKAGSYVGDEDWRIFVDQMKEVASASQGSQARRPLAPAAE